MTNEKTNSYEIIKALEPSSAIRILMELCKDVALCERIVALAKNSLSAVNTGDIADKVFRSLNSIQIEDLWDNSGTTRWGYKDETEVAFEMIGDVLVAYTRKMEQYRELGMKKEEKEFCKGIISGLLRYGESGSNAFYDAVPDDPYTHAENVLYDWKKNNSDEDIAEIQAVYDSFFSDEEADA